MSGTDALSGRDSLRGRGEGNSPLLPSFLSPFLLSPLLSPIAFPSFRFLLLSYPIYLPPGAFNSYTLCVYLLTHGVKLTFHVNQDALVQSTETYKEDKTGATRNFHKETGTHSITGKSGAWEGEGLSWGCRARRAALLVTSKVNSQLSHLSPCASPLKESMKVGAGEIAWC